MSTVIKIKRSTNTGSVPASGTLAAGELAVNITDKKMWVGTGGESDAPVLIVDYNAIVGGVSDGDKGQITVSSGGSVWTINNNTVTVAKINASGSPSSTTFLRGDGQWATPSGSGGIVYDNGTGLLLDTNNIFSIDPSVVATVSYVDAAVSGISIPVYDNGTGLLLDTNNIFSIDSSVVATVSYVDAAVSGISIPVYDNGTGLLLDTNNIFSIDPSVVATVSYVDSSISGISIPVYDNGTGLLLDTNNIFSIDPSVVATVSYVDSAVSSVPVYSGGSAITIDTNNAINLNFAELLPAASTIDKYDYVPFLDMTSGGSPIGSKLISAQKFLSVGLSTNLSTAEYDGSNDERITVAVQDQNPNAFSIQTLQNGSGSKLNIFKIDTDVVSGANTSMGGTAVVIEPSTSVTIGLAALTINSTGNIALTNADSITFNTDDGTLIGVNEITAGSTGEVQVNGDLFVTGDLIIGGTNTTLNTTTVNVEDNNIQLGVVLSPSDTTADGGGITLKGSTDKTISWDNANDNWTLSEHLNIPSGKVYKINNTEVLNATTLGSGVTGSSLTSVGTLTSGTLGSGFTTVAVSVGGTGTSTGSITGSGALTFTAGGTDTNINLVPNGTGTVDVASKRITNVQNPSVDQDAATKKYVDDVAQGLHIHATANAATTATLATLSGATVSYSGGTQAITWTGGTALTSTFTDGQSFTVSTTEASASRLLVKNEGDVGGLGSQYNGVYYCYGARELRRSSDSNTAVEWAGGDFCFVLAGTIYNNTGWVQTEKVTTLDTDPILWEQFSGAGLYTADEVTLTKTGSQFSIKNTYSGQSSITTVGTLTSGTLGSGFTTVATSVGGTGLTSFTTNGAVYATSTSELTTGTLPVASGGTGITSFGSGVAAWLGTPSSANLAAAVTGETGSGALVFGTSPAFTTSVTTGSTTFSAFNTTATTLSIGGAATTLTLGATSGTASIRNATLNVGNTTATISTTSGVSTNHLTLAPYGDVILAPTSSLGVGGEYPKITVQNTDGGLGTVDITGGDLYLGTRTDENLTVYPVDIIFEGVTANGFETTLTVTDPTADRTITLPNATGTVGLVAGSDTQVQFNDGGTALGGDSGLTYNKTTDTLTVGGNLVINAQGDLRLSDSDSSNYVAFQAPATVTNDNIYTLPSAVGSANQVLQIASVAGNDATLQWGTVSGGSGLTWTVTTADTSMAVDNGYLANKSSGTLTLTLPTTAAVGKTIRVSGMQNTWRIAQNASQIIHFGKSDTTTGTGGYLESSNARDTVELVCCVANNEWNVVSSIGNITIV